MHAGSSDSRPVSGPAVGLVPAAGFGTRLTGFEGSKELVSCPDPVARASRPVCEHVLGALATARVDRVCFVVREGKRDLLAYLSRRPTSAAPRVDLVLTPPTPSVPHTIDRAYQHLRGRRVLFGFPDLVFEPLAAGAAILARLEASRALVILAAFPSDRPDKTDLIELDGDHVVAFHPRRTGATNAYTWLLAAWRPEFTERLHAALADAARGGGSERSRELHLHAIFERALDDGASIEAVRFEGGRFVDVGTPEDVDRIRAT